MAFRIVKINNRCKLETKLNYLVVRNESETRILLDEIQLLIIETQQAAITSALISELMNHKIKVIFCDSTHNPQGELVSYNSSFDSYNKFKNQIEWNSETKAVIWSNIIYQKISNQKFVLNKYECIEAANLLEDYLINLKVGDATNREGLAAKVYFNALFGKSFDRRDKNNKNNVYLNYGYSLILAAVNREITSLGYLTQVGIHHIGETNPFNLGCDLMEPFRPFVDDLCLSGKLNETNYKLEIMHLFDTEINCNNRNSLLQNAIHDYVQSVISALNKNNQELVYGIKFKSGNV